MLSAFFQRNVKWATLVVMCIALTRHNPSWMPLFRTSPSTIPVIFTNPRRAGTSNQRCSVNDFTARKSYPLPAPKQYRTDPGPTLTTRKTGGGNLCHTSEVLPGSPGIFTIDDTAFPCSFTDTSLLSVYTAGCGAVPSGAAPAHFWEGCS